MKSKLIAGSTVTALAAVILAAAPSDKPSTVSSGVGPTLESIGTLTFGPNGVLYAADPNAASIYALELGAPAAGAVAGTQNVANIDQQIAAMLGTGASDIAIRDLVVDSRNRNTYLAVMRGTGAAAKPVLMRVDGAGKLSVVELENVKFTSVTLPNAPAANPTARTNPRTQSVTDMSFADGRLIVAGLSNEEFASKLWTIKYPFEGADRGTSVEIYHGNHAALETRSPVHAFVTYNVAGQAHVIAGYLCTPLVKFPVASLTPGAKVLGTTIAELGNGNRPIDMVMYKKDGKDFLLMTNTNRGVMKIATDRFATEPAITARVAQTGGIPAEAITTMTGIQQLDLLDATRSIVISRTAAGALNLEAVILP